MMTYLSSLATSLRGSGDFVAEFESSDGVMRSMNSSRAGRMELRSTRSDG